VKVATCSLCGAVVPFRASEETLQEAEQNFGARPDPDNVDEETWAQICDRCFKSLTICVGCNHRWCSTAGGCPQCGGVDVKRGQECMDYEKARGVIGDGTVDFSKEESE
jgi:hypothetical protein